MSSLQFKSPRLLIVDYCDAVIRQVDIYTEKLLEKYGETDLVPNKPNPIEGNYCRNLLDQSDETYEIFGKEFTSKYLYEDEETSTFRLEPGVTKIHNYLSQVRTRAIEEIRKVQEYNLDMYESNRDSYSFDRENVNEEKLEELKCRLFQTKFCFTLEIDLFEHTSNNWFFKLYTFLSDFYLSPSHLELLRNIIIPNRPSEDSYLNIDEITLLVHLAKEYIVGLWKVNKCGVEVIKITKERLLAIEKVTLIYSNIRTVNLDVGSTNLNLSSIKLLFIQILIDNDYPTEIVSLSALSNLQCLILRNVKLKSSCLHGLLQLKKLILSCDLTEFDLDYLGAFIGLQILEINRLNRSIDLKDNYCLKWLSLTGIENLNLIKDLNENIMFLNLSFSNITSKEASKFFAKQSFEQLKSLNLYSNQLSMTSKHLFLKCPNLMKLDLERNCLEDLNFLDCESLCNLIDLNLTKNGIKTLKSMCFSKLTKLRSLCLIENQIEQLEPNCFQGLTQLKELLLSNNYLGKLKNNCLAGLTNLKKLALNGSQLSQIESSVFADTPNLVELELESNELELQTKTLEHLMNLKKLDLCDNKPKISEDLLIYLRNLNIEVSQ